MVAIFQRRSRSAPCATRARYSPVRPRRNTFTSGFALRLWYQAGCFGAPPLDAISTRSSPSRAYSKGVRRSWPLLAPRCSITRIGSSPSAMLSRPFVAGMSRLSIGFAMCRKNHDPAREETSGTSARSSALALSFSIST